jgi:uncharacterized protein YndB with AHSA1/START domain
MEDLRIDIEQEMVIAAPMATVYESMIHQLTEGLTGENDAPLHLELERKPGGRWFRNLGEGRGHVWGFVQSIREPDLIELNGPMFMSYPVNNHVIIRFEEAKSGTRLIFRHRAFGLLEKEHREGVVDGWNHMLEKVKVQATHG